MSDRTFKIICGTFISVIIFALIAIAGQTYAPESLDNTVEQRNQVEVKETDTSTVVKETILTLMQIDLDIQKWKDLKITIDQKITALQAVRVLVEAEADKVILKP